MDVATEDGRLLRNGPGRGHRVVHLRQPFTLELRRWAFVRGPDNTDTPWGPTGAGELPRVLVSEFPIVTGDLFASGDVAHRDTHGQAFAQH